MERSKSGPVGVNEAVIEYTASELVNMARLKRIEREHKSIGATLDKRLLYKIEEPKLPQQKEDSRSGRRGAPAPTSSVPVPSAKDSAQASKEKNAAALLEQLKQEGAGSMANDFASEELIWKTKASSANYSANRRFNHPEMQDMLDHFTAAEKEEYHRRCRDAVINLCQKFRASTNAVKSDMNEACIFHPDANAQRAHCIYITKVFKAIKAEKIEDPILRAMKEEAALKKQQEALEEQRLFDHWSDHTLPLDQSSKSGAGMKKSPISALSVTLKPIDASGIATEDKNQSPSKNQQGQKKRKTPNSGKKGNKMNSASTNSLSATMNSAASNDMQAKASNTLRSSSAKHGKNASSTGSLANSKSGAPLSGTLNSQSAAHHGTPASKGMVANLNNSHLPVMPANGGAAADDNSTAGRSSVGAKEASNVHFSNLQDKILFTKMKKGKMASTDPRKLLPEEAARLERGETSDVVKEQKRSNLLHDQAAELVLEKLHNDCIFGASGGVSKKEDKLFPNRSWRDIPGLTDDGPSSPESTISKTLGGAHPDTAAKTKTRTSKSLAFDSDDEGDLGVGLMSIRSRPTVDQQFKDMDAADEFQLQKVVSFDVFQDMFKTYTEAAKTGPVPNGSGSASHSASPTKGLHRRNPQDANNSPMAKSVGNVSAQGAGQMLSADSAKSSPTHSVGADQKSGGSAPSGIIQPVDVVGALKATDVHFNAFMKITVQDNPTRKMIAKTTSVALSQPRKLRQIPPVGKEALDLSHIRSLKQSSGLHNVFQDMVNYKDEMKDGAATLAPVVPKDDEDEIVEEEEDEEDEDDMGDEKKPGMMAYDGDALETGRTSTPGTSRRARRYRRPKSRSGADGSAANAGAGEEKTTALQAKIVAVHNALQLPTMTRISFMYKYSSAAYSRELSLAVDLWAEIAAMAICRNETAKLLKKLRYGFCVMPLHHGVLLNAIAAEMDPVLISNDRSASENMPGSPTVGQEPGVSEAYASYVHIRACIRTTFLTAEESGGTNYDENDWDESETLVPPEEEPGTGAHNEKQALANLTWISSEIDQEITNRLRSLNEELDDVVYFGNQTCKEWLNSLSALTKPPANAKDGGKSGKK